MPGSHYEAAKYISTLEKEAAAQRQNTEGEMEKVRLQVLMYGTSLKPVIFVERKRERST